MCTEKYTQPVFRDPAFKRVDHDWTSVRLYTVTALIRAPSPAVNYNNANRADAETLWVVSDQAYANWPIRADLAFQERAGIKVFTQRVNSKNRQHGENKVITRVMSQYFFIHPLHMWISICTHWYHAVNLCYKRKCQIISNVKLSFVSQRHVLFSPPHACQTPVFWL